MTKSTSADIYVAKESFTTIFEGVEIVVRAGTTRVRAGHPLLKGKAALFEPLEVHYDIEQATSAPGEARGAPAPVAPAAPTPPAAESTAFVPAKATRTRGLRSNDLP